MPLDTAARRLVVFRSRLLPPSQTFVRDQALALRHWQPTVLGFEAVPDGLSLDGLAHRIVPRGPAAAFQVRALAGLRHPGLTSALEESGAVLVHAHFGTDATDAWPSVRSAGLPLIVTLHGYDINIHRSWWERGHGGRDRRGYPRRLLRMSRHPATLFIAVSSAIRQRAVELGIPEEKLCICHIGVDTELFRPGGLKLEHRRRRILFVGRMVEKKAPLLLIQAFASLRKLLPEVELEMIGDGPLLPAARQLATDLQIPVEFQGACSPEHVRASLQQARLFCLPSMTAANGDAEGLPISLLEAQASGVPVITCAQGEIEGLLPGRSGQVVPQGNLTRLVEALHEWLRDDSLIRSAAAEARQFVQQVFDIRTCTQRLEHVYDRVAAIKS